MAIGRLKVWNPLTLQWEYVAPGLMGATGPTGGAGATGAQGPSGTPGTGNVSTTGAQTLTNKLIRKRFTVVASTATITLDAPTQDVYEVTALAENVTVGEPSYTPINGDQFVIKIKDNGTARAITWNATWFKSLGATLPLTTVAGKWVYVGVFFSGSDNIFHAIAVTQE